MTINELNTLSNRHRHQFFLYTGQSYIGFIIEDITASPKSFYIVESKKMSRFREYESINHSYNFQEMLELDIIKPINIELIEDWREL